MEWLSQNWFWLAITVAAFFLMHRMHAHRTRHAMDHGHGGHNSPLSDRAEEAGPPVDPVSHRPVLSGNVSISAVYRGRAFYFESRENRDVFESDPAKYLEGESAARPHGEAEQSHRQHRRHGC